MRMISQGGARAAKHQPGDGLRARSSARRPSRRIGFWIVIALLVHAEAVLVIGLALYAFAPRNDELARTLNAGDSPSIDVGMVDEDAAREIIADLEKQQEEHQKEEARKEEESLHPPGQVVDVPAPRQEVRPDDARFVSEHDTSVEHETKKYGRFDDNARQGDRSGNASISQPAAPKGDGRLAMRTPDLGRALRNGLPGPATRGAQPGTTYGAPDPGDSAEGGMFSPQGSSLAWRTGGATRGGLGPSLMPTEQQLARAVGGGTQDALANVDDGEETALNSKKWRFASFFNRVKRQVAEHWHPEEAYRQRDPTGMIYGRKNRYTELRIQLKPDGHVQNIAVFQPSGLDFLDDEALAAFKQAAPFPNPPRQLIEANGLINFGFGFLFDLNGPPEMRWFKY
jgi:TonB family protein